LFWINICHTAKMYRHGSLKGTVQLKLSLCVPLTEELFLSSIGQWRRGVMNTGSRRLCSKPQEGAPAPPQTTEPGQYSKISFHHFYLPALEGVAYGMVQHPKFTHSTRQRNYSVEVPVLVVLQGSNYTRGNFIFFPTDQLLLTNTFLISRCCL